MSTSTTTTTRDRALLLLGQGIPPSAVALTLGVDPSAISILLADSDFADQVTQAKFASLSKHTERDTRLDRLEDTLIEKVENLAQYVTRPMEATKMLQVVNAAKRRSYQTEEPLTQKSTIVQLIMPQIIMSKFQSNIHNQVIQVGEQSLLTMQSNKLVDMLAPQQKGVENVERREITLSTDREAKTA